MRMHHAFPIFFLLTTTSAQCGKQYKDEDIGTVIGINLGTTYSSVGVYKEGQMEIIADDYGNRIIPSYVSFTTEGKVLIGEAAKNQLITNPNNTVYDFKRFIGRDWNEHTVQNDIKSFPFKVVEKNSKIHISIKIDHDEKVYAPEEISAIILHKMKKTAEAYLGQTVTHAVLTVPTYFNNAQRQATKDAGVIAGLNVMRMINEATAAAIAYGLEKRDGEKNVLVFDLGGGTFDVSLLAIENGVVEVVATNREIHLEGDDFDQRVMDHLIKLYQEKSKDIGEDNRAVQSKLRREVEKAKRILSSGHQVRIEIESFFEGENFSETLTRAKFEELNMDLFKSTMKPVQKVLEAADMNKKDVDDIIMVGGSTHIPIVQQLLKEFFDGKEPLRSISPEEAVVYGAAIMAKDISEEDTDVVFMCSMNTLSVGIKTIGGEITKIIPCNSIVPTKRSQMFSTTYDKQHTVTIQVYQGEDNMVKFLGKFNLTGIPPTSRGVPQIKVTIEIDPNGVLIVSAEDTVTGNTNNNVFTNYNDKFDGIVPMNQETFTNDENSEGENEDKYELQSYDSSLKIQVGDRKELCSKLSDDTKVEETIDEKVKLLEVNHRFEEHKKQQKLKDPINNDGFKNEL